MLQIINSSNFINSSFSIVYEVAKASKCFFFFLDASTNTLYGVPQEPYKVHVINLPINIEYNLVFEIFTDTTPIDKLNEGNFEYFQAGPELRYTFIPNHFYNDYLNGNLKLMQNNAYQTGDKMIYRNEIYNIVTTSIIPSYKALADDGEYFKMSQYISQIEGIQYAKYLNVNICNSSYQNIQIDEAMIPVFNSKVTDGAQIVSFKDGGKIKHLTLFKGFITALKADKVDLEIFNDKPDSFLAKFIIEHKKNPFKSIKAKFIEHIYSRFLNI